MAMPNGLQSRINDARRRGVTLRLTWDEIMAIINDGCERGAWGAYRECIKAVSSTYAVEEIVDLAAEAGFRFDSHGEPVEENE